MNKPKYINEDEIPTSHRKNNRIEILTQIPEGKALVLTEKHQATRLTQALRYQHIKGKYKNSEPKNQKSPNYSKPSTKDAEPQ